MDKFNKFGGLLRELRKMSNISLGDMADRLGIAASYLSDVELGRRHPFRTETIERCGEILGLSNDQVGELIAAASVQRRAVELPLDPTNQAAVDAGAALMREWPNYSSEAYRQIKALAEQLAAAGKKK